MIFYDFEVFRYDWLVVLIDLNARKETVIINDPDKLKRFYEEHKGVIWAGYNSRNYDQYILKAILCGFDPKPVNDWIIAEDKPGYRYSSLFREYPLINYDVMPNPPISLKALEAFMGHSIKETSVPFDIDRPLTEAELAETVKYCRHDVEQTVEVWLRRKEDEFDAQMSLVKAFHLPISDIGRTKAQLSAKILGAVQREHNDEFEIEFPPSLRIEKYTEVLNWYKNPLNRDYSKTLELDVAGVPHVFAWGGLHGAIPKYHGEGWFVNVDVASYRVCKGSRASKKSKTTALNIIKRMMQYPEANTLVVRKVFRTLKDSCFTELKWAINRLGVSAYWEIKESPLEMTYLPTGQKIYFRGLDDPLKVTSITVEIGFLCWCWIEEAYEIMNEADFDMLDESIRGAIPEETGLFKQITLTFNPWNEKHWIRKRFFGEITGKDAQGNPTYKFHDSWISPDGQIYATTTNYLCNEWLDTADLKVFNTMKENNPRRYKVAGLGGWGIVDGLIFDNWREEAFDYLAISKKPDVKSSFGLDFGYTNDPTALFCGLVSEKERTIWVFDELYEKALTNRAICDRITGMGYGKERIKADCAEPKSIDELRDAGLHRIRAARKGKDSVNNGIQYIQGYTIIVHPRCVNFITEISNYTWAEDKFGAKINVPIDDFNHLMDAMRYGLEDMLVGPAFSFD